MGIFTDSFANGAPGALYRGQLIHPVGGTTGIAYLEGDPGQFVARATINGLAATVWESTRLVVKKVLTQDDAGYAASTSTIIDRDYSHVSSAGQFIGPIPTAMFTPTVKIDPIQLAAVASGAGNGDTLVNQDIGGVDNLRVLDTSNNPVDNAPIRAYLTSDYTANATTAMIRANSTSGVDGRWVSPMFLDHGFNYTFAAELPGVLNAITMTADV